MRTVPLLPFLVCAACARGVSGMDPTCPSPRFSTRISGRTRAVGYTLRTESSSAVTDAAADLVRGRRVP